MVPFFRYARISFVSFAVATIIEISKDSQKIPIAWKHISSYTNTYGHFIRIRLEIVSTHCLSVI